MGLISRDKISKLTNLLKRNDFLISLLITVIVIFVGVFFGYHNNKVVPVSTSTIARYTLEPNNPLSFMSNWDGPDYISIATYGYSGISLTNFFPLYPILIHVVNYVIPSLVTSALIISWVCLVGAIYFYIKIIKKLFNLNDNFEALRGLYFFILFPTGVFLIATYTESLFALLALGAIYFALNKKYLAAALMTLPVTATHDDGIFVLILVALILLEQKVKVTKVLATLVIGSLGISAYMIYLSVKFKNALAFIDAQKSHGWLGHSYVSNLENSVGYFNAILFILLIISVIYWWKRHKSFSIYSFLFLLIPIAGGQFGGFNRYVLMAFPLQFMLYEKFRNSKTAYPIAIAFLGFFWAYFLFQYAGGYVGG